MNRNIPPLDPAQSPLLVLKCHVSVANVARVMVWFEDDAPGNDIGRKPSLGVGGSLMSWAEYPAGFLENMGPPPTLDIGLRKIIFTQSKVPLNGSGDKLYTIFG